jgi:TetR/AcrR family transcriptional repressor of nem operon
MRSGWKPEDRLDRAMQLFWEKGYYDTSIEDLMQRTGLHRAAVYGEYGNKQRLFEALLRRYREKITETRLAPLRALDAGFPQIVQFFGQFREGAAAPANRFGCLMCLTAAEVAPHIRSVARIVSSYLDDMRALFRSAWLNATARGEVRQSSDPEVVADYLVGAVLGLMALARAPVPRSATTHYVDGVLSFLESLRSKGGRA